MKTSTLRTYALTATTMAALALSAPAFAGPGKAKGKVKGDADVNVDIVIGDRDDGYRDYRSSAKDCPPGLRDKGCMPPGQAKKLYEGYRIPADYDYRYFNDYSRYDLPPPPRGQRYMVIDGQVVLVSEDTRTVLNILDILL